MGNGSVQQDPTLAHKADVTQGNRNDLARNRNDLVTPNMRPPSSPDLNLMDFYLWGAVEQTNNRPHHSKESLKAVIEHVLGNMQETPLIRACSHFRSRIKAVNETEGTCIE